MFALDANRSISTLRGTNSSSSVLIAEAATAGPATPDVAATVVDVVPLVMRAIRREMRAAASSSLTVPQLRALLFVRRNPGTNLSALADHLGIGLTGASGLVDRLVRNQMLARETDPNERRRIQLTVTKQGMQHIDAANTATRQLVATLLAGLKPTDARTVEDAMAILRRAFQNETAA